MDTDYKAASVLEILSEHLIDATVDFQAGQGIHQFSAEFDHARHKVDFPDDIMQSRTVVELAAVALAIFDRTRSGTSSTHVMVRPGVFQTILKAATSNG